MVNNIHQSLTVSWSNAPNNFFNNIELQDRVFATENGPRYSRQSLGTHELNKYSETVVKQIEQH